MHDIDVLFKEFHITNHGGLLLQVVNITVVIKSCTKQNEE